MMNEEEHAENLLDELKEMIGETARPLTVAVIGIPGAGKSSFINTMIASIIGNYRQWTRMGYFGESGKTVTLRAVRIPRESYVSTAHETLQEYQFPDFVDIAGLPNSNDKITRELLKLLFYGRIPSNVSVAKVADNIRKYGAWFTGLKYPETPECTKVDRVIFVASSALKKIPVELMQAVLTVLQRERDIPVFGVLTKKDLNEQKEDSEEIEIEFRKTLGLSQLNFLHCTNYCDENINEIQDRTKKHYPELDIPVCKFLIQICGYFRGRQIMNKKMGSLKVDEYERNHEKIMTEKGTSSWQNVTFILRYTIIYIIIFALFLIIPCIHSIINDTERKKLEDGKMHVVENESRKIEENVNYCERYKELKCREDFEFSTKVFEQKFKQFKKEIEDIKFDLEQYKKNTFNIIESLKQQITSEKDLREIQEQQLQNKITNIKENMTEQYKTCTKAQKEMNDHINDLETQGRKLESNDIKLFRNHDNVSKSMSTIYSKMESDSKKNEERDFISYVVDGLQISVIIIMFGCILKLIKKIELTHFWQQKKNPVIVSFSGDCIRSHRELARGLGFINDPLSFVINNLQDLRQLQQIQAKIFIVFIDSNERHIILEEETEPVRIRSETIESILRMSGTPVVIYRLHSNSQTLEDGLLYSRNLTSIQTHPLLKKLSSMNCVLSIDQQFSEYQISHLKGICNV